MARAPYKPRARLAEQEALPEVDQRALALAQAERGLLAAKRALKIKRARGAGVDALQAFIELHMPDPEFPDDPDKSLFDCEPHHRILMEMVANVEARTALRQACSMPPQHGKSLILSRFGLAWIMGRNPHLRLLFATYADGLAQTRGDEVRTVLQCATFRETFPKAALRSGSQSKTEMSFVAGGSLNFLGRGTATTGRPADLFIIDDPYAGDGEAQSDAIRAQVKDWYSAVVQTRCPVWAPILIVHTRWSDDDLIAWQCDPEHPANKADPSRIKKWKYVNLPTPIDSPELAAALGLPVGSALWPKRFPLAYLAEIRSNDARIYAALYQGQPAPEDGDFFKAKDFHTYNPDELPKRLRYFAASDHAVSEKQRADPTCMVMVGVDSSGTVWVLDDIFWERAATDVVVERMIDMLKRWEPLWWRAASDHISKSIGPFLRKRMLERKVFGNIVEGSEAGDKVKKAQAIQARMSMGKVRYPAGAPWLMKAKTEMLKFPHAKHDDFVDAMSHIGRGLRGMFGVAEAPGVGHNGGPPMNDNPRVGSLAWIKFAATRESRLGAIQKRLRSM